MFFNNFLFYFYEYSLRAMASYVFNRTLSFAKREVYQSISESLYRNFGASLLVWAVEKNFTNLAIDMIHSIIKFFSRQFRNMGKTGCLA